MWSYMTVLITGGAGFIGSNLVRYFNEHAPDVGVRVIDDLSTGRLSNLDGARVNFTKGSILERELLSEVMEGADSVVHLAALGSVPRSVIAPIPTHEANSTGTLYVMEAARSCGVGHVVAASSSSVYGTNPNLPKSEFDWTRPMSPYAVSKQATEGYVLAYNLTYGMKTLAFRFFNVFGPGQPADHDYAAVIPRFLDAALGGRALTVHGDGRQSRDFTYVESVCSIVFDAVQRQVSSQDPVNLAFGTNTSLLELIDAIEMRLGTKLRVEHIEPRAGDVRASQADGRRVQELFPGATPVSLDQGLGRTIDWFRSVAQ